ncbi:hypothetical protein [Rhodoplanes roseus]|uniref:DUF5666 domain-containing protein n=1 Tax=Rhodoplanes roseus TaxID=29409 RepID=A0A327KS34_9BRAD|nr:hypothetical protein [Rhodoplanes roseus]RAI40513.1 hypothetical protein CH341_23625 [Rhodoplanes roseus]
MACFVKSLVAVALSFVLAGAAMAQAPQQAAQTARIRGQITAVDGDAVTIRTREGGSVSVDLAPDARVMALEKASLADVKAGRYIGVTAMPQPDGRQRALAIHIFTEQQRGVGEGHRPWDLAPGSTMTNAAVDTVLAEGTAGEILTVKYKDGEKTVVVPPETPVVAYAPGRRDEVKPGAEVIVTANLQPPAAVRS